MQPMAIDWGVSLAASRHLPGVLGIFSVDPLFAPGRLKSGLGGAVYAFGEVAGHTEVLE